jgi:hypothetical protein
VLASVLAACLLSGLGPTPDPGPDSGPGIEPGPEVEIVWRAAPDCGSQAQLVARIEAVLGRPLGQPGDPELRVEATIVAEGDGLVLRLAFERPVVRVRELRGRDCEALGEAAAVVLAMTIDPLLPEPEPEPEPEREREREREREPEPEPEPIVPAAPEPEPAPAKPEPEPAPAGTDTASELGLLLRLAGGVQSNALPTLAGGPSVALGLRWRALRAELVGAWWLTRTASFEQTPEVGASLSLGWVAPRLCGVPATARVGFPLCAGIELGGMRARGLGLADARAQTLPWIAAELGAGLHVALTGPLALSLAFEGVVPLTRPGFTVAGLGELHRTGPFALQALIGVEIELARVRVTDRRGGGQGGAHAR